MVNPAVPVDRERRAMTVWALVLTALVTVQSQEKPPQEPKPVPKDSVEVLTAGCIKGRVFTATGAREGETQLRGPDITGRSFRLAGKGDVMKQVKEHNGHYVEVSGLILKSALESTGVGTRVGNTRVVVGAPRTDPMSMSMSQPQGGVPVMDISGLRYLESSCPIPRK
jgi:hypothetical protein